MKIGVVYDAGGGGWDRKDIAAVLGNVRSVRRTLQRLGHQTIGISVRLGDVGWLRKAQACDAIFNLCEGVGGLARFEDFAVAALELIRVPYTGCLSSTITLAHRKDVANTLLAGAGIPIPPFRVTRGRVPDGLEYPVIVKPVGEDASVGIDAGAVCRSANELEARLAHSPESWGDLLVQEYVEGREVNVGFVGRELLPLSEIVFGELPPGSWPIVTYAAKWETGSPEDRATVPVCPAPLDSRLAQRVIEVATAAWDLLGKGIGYGRVDLRVSPDGTPYVLEVNPNPDISTDAGLARMAAAHGWSYQTLIERVLDETLARSGSRSPLGSSIEASA